MADIFEALEMAEPPDRTDIEAWESMVTSLGALLGKGISFYFRVSSMIGSSSGRSFAKFLLKQYLTIESK